MVLHIIFQTLPQEIERTSWSKQCIIGHIPHKTDSPHKEEDIPEYNFENTRGIPSLSERQLIIDIAKSEQNPYKPQEVKCRQNVNRDRHEVQIRGDLRGCVFHENTDEVEDDLDQDVEDNEKPHPPLHELNLFDRLSLQFLQDPSYFESQ